MSTRHFRTSLTVAAVLAAFAACSGGENSSSSSSSTSSSSGAASGSSSSSSTGGSSSGQASSSGSGSGSSGSSGSVDQARLERYRRELPQMGWLEAPQPDPASQSSGGQPLVGAPAEYPEHAKPIVQGINGSVRFIIETLKAITDQQPTVYNSETLEFVWGPHENEDSAAPANDKWMVYAKDEGTGADFRYTWAILRGIGNDTATYAPVIWGGANPDADESNDEYGSGVILWDFEANFAWEEEHNPGHGDLDRGRYITLYARGPDEQDATKVNTFVVAAFRNFIPRDNPTAQAADLDYLYGHVQATDHGFSFVDFNITGDIHTPATDGGTPSTLQETLGLRLAFFNNGIGRGEARLTGGDVEAEGWTAGEGVECWGDNVERLYFELNAQGGDAGTVQVAKEGELTDCHDVFEQSLDALNIPSLADVPAEMMAALDAVATNGIPQE
ncbi:MAG: hypothetical protein AB2A00_35225 [Myxococcota bacterium]